MKILFRTIAILVFSLTYIMQSYGQTHIEDVLESSLDHIINDENQQNIELLENNISDIYELINNPVNINTATVEQLCKIPFISKQIAENIVKYIAINGSIKSKSEIILIDGIDYNTARKLLLFVKLSKYSLDDNCILSTFKQYTVKKGSNNILTQVDIPLYLRKGFSGKYVGTQFRSYLKYSYNHSDKFSVGITAENDAGEPLFALHNKKGFDYYSFYLLINNLSFVRTLALGNYRLSFGQGLVVDNISFSNKNFHSNLFDFHGRNITKHSSTDEYNYFKGFASKFRINNNLDVSAFYSNKRIDTKLVGGNIQSIHKSGLHRTHNEVSMRNNSRQQMFGANISFRRGMLNLGTTAVYYFFDKNYTPRKTHYNPHPISDKSFFNIGIDYSYRIKNLFIEGELSASKQGIATIDKLTYQPMKILDLSLLYRYYSPQYNAMFGRSYAQSSSLQAENGVYLNVNFAPFSAWNFALSIDYFAFTTNKYRISRPSSGIETIFRADYNVNNRTSLYAKYRYMNKMRDIKVSDNLKLTKPTHNHTLRLGFNHDVNTFLNISTVADIKLFSSYDKGSNKGFGLWQHISCQIPKIKSKILLTAGYFNTQTSDTRLYMLNRGMINSLQYEQYIGHGISLNSTLKLHLTSKIQLISQFRYRKYFDKNHIGSGYDLIQSSSKADISLQANIKI